MDLRNRVVMCVLEVQGLTSMICWSTWPKTSGPNTGQQQNNQEKFQWESSIDSEVETRGLEPDQRNFAINTCEQRCVDNRVYYMTYCVTLQLSWPGWVFLPFSLSFLLFFPFSLKFYFILWGRLKGRGWIQKNGEMNGIEMHDVKE